MQDAFVIFECLYRVSSFQKSYKIWIPAQNHCGNDSCYKNIDDDVSWFSLAIMPFRRASKRKATGFAGGYLLSKKSPNSTRYIWQQHSLDIRASHLLFFTGH
jgi:hypothetical protein